MHDFKHALFAFEMTSVAQEFQVVDQVLEAFAQQGHGPETLVQRAHSMDEAAQLIDAFKGQSCGSPYSIALINLIDITAPDELAFLLKKEILGDPQTVFLATLRGMQGPVYGVARAKVDHEAELSHQRERFAAPSCIDSYGSAKREETALRAAQFLNAYLDERDMQSQAKRTGTFLPTAVSPAFDLIRASATTFYGRVYQSATGYFKPVKRRAPSGSQTTH